MQSAPRPSALQPVEDVPETRFPRHLLDRRTGVGDGEEALRRFGLTHRLLGLLVDGFDQPAAYAPPARGLAGKQVLHVAGRFDQDHAAVEEVVGEADQLAIQLRHERDHCAAIRADAVHEARLPGLAEGIRHDLAHRRGVREGLIAHEQQAAAARIRRVCCHPRPIPDWCFVRVNVTLEAWACKRPQGCASN